MAPVVFSCDIDPTVNPVHRLTWATDVQTAGSQAEQRRALRDIPLHIIEFAARAITPREKAFLDASTQRGAPDGFKIPLWFDRQTLGASLLVGVTNIPCDTATRYLLAGTEAILWSDAFTYELVTIDVVNADSIDIVAPTTLPWRANALLMPVRVGQMLQRFTPARLSRDGVQFDLSFAFAPEGIVGDEVWPAIFKSYDLLNVFPHRVFDDSEGLDNFTLIVESKAGIFDVAFLSELHPWERTFHWHASDRDELSSVNSFLRNRLGRYLPFWVPTWSSDLLLVNDASSGATSIVVEKTFAPLMRSHIAIITPTGMQPVKVLGLTEVGDTYVLDLEEPLEMDIRSLDTLISYLELVRLSSDSVDIESEALNNFEIALPHIEIITAGGLLGDAALLGAAGDCLTPNSTTSDATSGLSPTRTKGDDFSNWSLTEYEDFREDTIDNVNYENGSRAHPYTVHPLPPLPAYFWEHFDDTDVAFPYTPPGDQPNRNRISQLAVNGGHRTLKAVKTSDDLPSLFNGYEIWASENSTVRYAVWARLRYQYSANYPLVGSGLGTYLIQLKRTSGGHTYDATIATGTGFNGHFEDVVTVEHRATPNAGTTRFDDVLGDTADIASSGTPRELVLYAGRAYDEYGVAVPNVYRVAAWVGDAFGTLVKLYDETKPTTIGFEIDDIVFMRPKVGPDLVPDGEDVICYECIEWEYEFVDDSFGGTGNFDPYGVDGFVPTPRVLTSIVVTPDPFTVAEGATEPLTAVGYDQIGDVIATGPLTWDSSDDAVATVDGAGVVTGVLAGSCIITATAGLIVSNDANGTVEAESTSREVGAFLQLKVDTLTDEGYVHADPVASWTELLNGYSPTQASGGNKPLYHSGIGLTLGPNVYFEFDDFLNWLDGIFSGLTEAEVFFVLAKVDDTPSDIIYTGAWNLGSAATDGTHYPYVDGNIYESFGTTLRKTFARPADDMEQLHVYNIVSAAGEYTVRYNGTIIFTTAVNSVAFPGTLARLGESKVDGFYLRAYVKEMLMFDAKRTGPRRDEIFDEIITEYGIVP